MATCVRQIFNAVKKFRTFRTIIVIMSLIQLYTMMSVYDYGQNISRESPQRKIDLKDIPEKSVNWTTVTHQMVGPILANDPLLLQYVKQRYLIPPSTKPYSLKLNEEESDALEYNKYRINTTSWMFLSELLTTLFQDEPPGFFVEARALDGEHLSNTLDLELKRNWKGLLVEADSETFGRLEKKNRRVWISHSCLAAFPYPHQTTFVKFTNHKSPKKQSTFATRGFGSLMESSDLQQRMQHGFPVFESVQCLPLQTLLWAINVTHVNLVSLHVEGVEMDVLKSFLGSKMTVDVWIVEHKHPDVILGQRDRVHPSFIYWFQSQGYTLYTYGHYDPLDYVFIRNESDIYKRAFSTRPPKYKKVF